MTDQTTAAAVQPAAAAAQPNALVVQFINEITTSLNAKADLHNQIIVPAAAAAGAQENFAIAAIQAVTHRALHIDLRNSFEQLKLILNAYPDSIRFALQERVRLRDEAFMEEPEARVPPMGWGAHHDAAGGVQPNMAPERVQRLITSLLQTMEFHIRDFDLQFDAIERFVRANPALLAQLGQFLPQAQPAAAAPAHQVGDDAVAAPAPAPALQPAAAQAAPAPAAITRPASPNATPAAPPAKRARDE